MSKCLFASMTSGLPCLCHVMKVLKGGPKNLHCLFCAKLESNFPLVSPCPLVLCRNGWWALRSAMNIVGKLWERILLYCSIGSVGSLGGMYDAHMIGPMFVGILTASVFSSDVGISIYLILHFIRNATPEFAANDLAMLLYPKSLRLLPGISPVSFMRMTSGFEFGSSR